MIKNQEISMKFLLNLLSLQFFLCSSLKSTQVSGKVYNIVPTQIPQHSCLHDSCMTLSDFALMSNNTALNTTLIVTGENHGLDVGILISNTVQFYMHSNSHNSVPVITCNESVSFSFTNIGSVYLNGLTFESCNDNKFESIDQLNIEYSIFLNSKSPLTIIKSSVSVSGTRFLSNLGNYRWNFRRLLEHRDQILTASESVGGALITSDSNINIENCHFIGNNASFGGAIFSEFGSHITISSSNFINNHAYNCISGHCSGGALLVDNRSIVVIIRSVFQSNAAEFDGGMIAAFNSTLLIFTEQYFK